MRATRSPLLVMAGAVAGAALAFAASAAVAEGTQPEPHTACVGRSGLVRIVDEAGDCRRNETVITLADGELESIPGPAGPAGPAGPQGPAGTLEVAGTYCPTGEAVRGFDADGDIVCTGGQPATDADGDGWTPPQDCDDAAASVNPGEVEILDGVDNDCDGEVDVVREQYGIGIGVCHFGYRNALTGEIFAPAGEPSEEVVDGLDNDCDGQTDEVDTSST